MKRCHLSEMKSYSPSPFYGFKKIVMKLSSCLMLSSLTIVGCTRDMPKNDNPVKPVDATALSIYSDKVAYTPGSQVRFTLNKTAANLKVRYWHLDTLLSDNTLSGQEWTWKAPLQDFTGYLVELHDDKDSVWASTAVDVSSDWSRFPRYGFLSKFGSMTNDQMNQVVKDLALHHINGLQFYDWQYKHHLPLAGTVYYPLNQWLDIANRPTYLSTVKGYIDQAHQYGMKAMFYNLAFGALNDAAFDGIQDQWYLFKDKNHANKDVIRLDPPMFKSSIYILDPFNTNWQSYLAQKNKDVYQVFAFDGFHIDQVGDRGSEYDYNGNSVDLAATYGPFIKSMKNAAGDKHLIMNAVNQYGQQGSIATAPVDFLYTEVWDPNNSYQALANIITNNDQYGNGKKTVLAAYMNYDKANSSGKFNTPGVLLTEAVIFAFGGSHLELGEHMLAKEYFPNDNLGMDGALSVGMIRYYDFLTAYENLLRDGGSFNNPNITCTNNAMTINNWPPTIGQVSVIGKKIGNKQVLHLINFNKANSLDWRDTNGTQPAPATVLNANLQLTTDKTVTKVWVASPDKNMGVRQSIPFKQNGNTISFTLPSLQYWDMVVVE